MRYLRFVLGIVLACLAVLVLPGASAREEAPNRPILSGVALADLPVEARATLRLIKNGGPFPYRKDGSIFQNREHKLPTRPHGYYREYTVPTPGARDRGARRIVAGSQYEYFYSSDHYRSFRRIQP